MVVLVSARLEPNDPNPFILLYADAVQPYVELVPFSWRSALTGKYDLVHAQWIEYIFRGGNGAKQVVKTGLSLAWLLRIALRHTPVVETVHNLRPHESAGRLERMLHRIWRSVPKVSIYLNASPENDLAAGAVLLHGAYPGEVLPRPSTRGTLLFIGQIRPYKGLPELLAAFSKTADPALRLRVMGAAADDSYADWIADTAAGDRRIELSLGYAPDRDVRAALLKSDLVVLPYKDVYNSGVALLALSAGRPVLLPAGPSARSLQAEFGESWVRLYDGNISAADLAAATSVELAEESLTSALERRDWKKLGALYAAIYEMAAVAGSPAEVREMIEADLRFTDHSAANAGSCP